MGASHGTPWVSMDAMVFAIESGPFFGVSSSRRRRVVCRVFCARVCACMKLGVTLSSLLVVALLVWLAGGVLWFGSPGPL